MLGRVDAKDFPPLARLTGERARPAQPQSPEQMMHNLRLHAAAHNASISRNDEHEGPSE